MSGLEARSYDGAGRVLAAFAPLRPHAAYAMAAALGALRNRITRRWPAAGEVQALFPRIDSHTAEVIAARIGALHERNRVLVRCVLRDGLAPVRPLVHATESLVTLTGPRILATFHVGAVHALGPVLERLRAPVLAFRSGVLFAPGQRLEVLSTIGDEKTRAAVLHRALMHLRGGGIVLLALDVVQDQFVQTRCLGRALRIAPGAFALARWSGAPILPVTARWQSSSEIRVDAGEPVSNADEAAAWLERYLLGSPSELTLGLLRMLLGVS